MDKGEGERVKGGQSEVPAGVTPGSERGAADHSGANLFNPAPPCTQFISSTVSEPSSLINPACLASSGQITGPGGSLKRHLRANNRQAETN